MSSKKIKKVKTLTKYKHTDNTNTKTATNKHFFVYVLVGHQQVLHSRFCADGGKHRHDAVGAHRIYGRRGALSELHCGLQSPSMEQRPNT